MVATPQRWESFQVSNRAIGIDLKRSQYLYDFGNYYANASTAFRAGMLVGMNASSEIVLCDGTEPLGFAKFDYTNTLYATIVDEYVQTNGLAATNLAHANLLSAAGAAAGVRVASGTGGTGAYTEAVDYTCSYVNGTITSLGVGIPLNAYVYVSYSYLMTAADIEDEGYNFWLRQDSVTIQAQRVTVCSGPGVIFTTQYDPSRTYAPNTNVYAGATADTLDGLVTTAATGDLIGHVLQPPTAADPWLGIRYIGSPVA